MHEPKKRALNVGVAGFLCLGLLANIVLIAAAGWGALGPANPNWFLGLAAVWLFAGATSVILIWANWLSFEFSCVLTLVILALTGIGICANLWAVLEISYVV